MRSAPKLESNIGEMTDSEYFLKFTTVPGHKYPVSAKLAPGIFAACGAFPGQLKGFNPQFLFVAAGQNAGFLHTSHHPANYPRHAVGVNAFHYSQTATLQLKPGVAAVTFSPCVANAGIEHESPDPSGETRQKLRHCGTGFLMIRDILQCAYSQELVRCKTPHAAVDESVNPDIEVVYQVSTNITPEIEKRLIQEGFFCDKFENSFRALSYSEETPDNEFDQGADASRNAVVFSGGVSVENNNSEFMQLYTKNQVNIANVCQSWICRTMAKEEHIEKQRKFGNDVQLDDETQNDEVKKFMASMVAPWFPQMNGRKELRMFTPNLKETVGPTGQCADGGGMYHLAHGVLRSGFTVAECKLMTQTLLHEMRCSLSTDVTEMHHSEVKAALIDAFGGLDEHPVGTTEGDMMNMYVRHMESMLTYLVRVISNSITSNPRESNYAFDQAVLAEIVHESSSDNERLSEGNCLPTKQVAQRFVTITTENMATEASVLNSMIIGGEEVDSIDDPVNPNEVRHAVIIDDCESLALKALKPILSVVKIASDLGLGHVHGKTPKYDAMVALSNKKAAEVVRSDMWESWRLDLSKEERQLDVEILTLLQHYYEKKCIQLDLGLVTSGSASTGSAKLEQAGENKHTNTSMQQCFSLYGPRRRFRVPDLGKLGASQTIASSDGQVGGHCIGIARFNFGTNYLTKSIDKKQITTSVRRGHNQVHVVEGTAAMMDCKPSNASVKWRKGNGVVGSSVFDLQSCEVTYKGSSLGALKCISEDCMLTPGTRLQCNLTVNEKDPICKENPFASFYRYIVVMGNHFAMTSDGNPGVKVVSLVSHGIEEHRDSTSSSTAIKMMSSFDQVNRNIQNTQKNAVGVKRGGRKTESMMVPVCDMSTQIYKKHLENIRIVRNSLDPPCVTTEVYAYRLANSAVLKSMESVFPANETMTEYTTTSLYVPKDQISLEMLEQKIRQFNQKHEGAVMASPVSVGMETGCYFVAMRLQRDV
jgi:hypothetical protein